MNASVRQIAPEFDDKGNPSWSTRLSAPDNSFAQINKIPDRVIPVVFVPGVMGSNLKGKGANEDIEWLLDSKGSMAGWLIRGPYARKKYLRPDAMRVMDSGKVAEVPGMPEEELRRRGWGEVGFMSYGESLAWLERSLNDFENPDGGERAGLRTRALQALAGEVPLTEAEYELSYRYRFPVYACGYNWLDSNAIAAERLSRCIDSIIDRYTKQKKKCEKVIVVTHSMGGLVARYCSEVLGCKSKILGIVHGVMPAIGAAAVYRRFKAGTEGDYVPSEVLGNDAAEMTAVLSSAPGPLQLLPTPEYGNGWLIIKDGNNEHKLPKGGDSYSEIYTVQGKWWSMCEERLINPMNTERDQKKRLAQTSLDWNLFAYTITKVVKKFHVDIRGEYHANTYAFAGVGQGALAYGNVTWTGGSLFGNDRPTDSLERPALTPEELKAKKQTENQINGMRTVKGTYTDGGWFPTMERSYFISSPDEPGDGTVPQRSGRAVRRFSRAYAEVQVGHEPAYKFQDGPEYERASRFTLRAIVKIAQDIRFTSLKY